MSGFDEQRLKLMDEYFRLTREELPHIAQNRGWAATEDAHFQRIVLDNVMGGVWYGKLKEPAVLSLSKSQLKKAVRLCEDMVSGRVNFNDINERSLQWREEKGVPPDLESYRRHVPEKQD
jgi:hypothetical protein